MSDFSVGASTCHPKDLACNKNTYMVNVPWFSSICIYDNEQKSLNTIDLCFKHSLIASYLVKREITLESMF